jgi:hypothetical protein
MEKTLMGITFAQLHGLTTEELNDYLAAFSASQLRSMILKDAPDDMNGRFEEFMTVVLKRTAKVYNDLMDDGYYDTMRKVYDTEERFGLAVDLMERVGGLNPVLAKTMSELMEGLADAGF